MIFENRHYFYKLYSSLSKKRKKQFYLLMLGGVFASLLEIITVTSVIPFIAIVLDPNFSLVGYGAISKSLNNLIQILNFENKETFFLIFFLSGIVISSLFRGFLLLASTRFAYFTGADIAKKIFRNILMQPYPYHSANNKSNAVASVVNKSTLLVRETLLPIMTIIISSIIIAIVSLVMVFFFTEAAVIAICFVASFYYFVQKITRRKLYDNGLIISKSQSKLIETVNNAIGSIKDVIIGKHYHVFLDYFEKLDLKTRKASASSVVIDTSPRFYIEALGIISISIFAFVNRETGSMTISAIAGIALVAQRILPLFQHAYSAWAYTRSSLKILKDILELLELKVFLDYSEKPTHFRNKIEIKNLSFQHHGSNKVTLKNVDLEIRRGESIAIIGPSGSGKSSLVDIILGLNKPSAGEVYVDGRSIFSSNKSINSWMRNISHVPQKIFLISGSIKENIIFGQEADSSSATRRLNNAVQISRLRNLFEEGSINLSTSLGDDGINISGGQRQRVAIARALYSDKSLICLDESTNALDEKTEMEIIKDIISLKDKTLIMITHRKNTLKYFDKVYEIRNSKLSLYRIT